MSQPVTRAIGAIERAAECADPLIEEAGKLAHALGHRHVADADLAHGMVHVGHEPVHHILRKRLQSGLASATAQKQEHFDGQGVEPPHHRIGQAPCLEEKRRARTRDDPVIEVLDDRPVAALAAETFKHPFSSGRSRCGQAFAWPDDNCNVGAVQSPCSNWIHVALNVRHRRPRRQCTYGCLCASTAGRRTA